MKHIERLKVLAREAEFQIVEREEPGGIHIIVIGDRVVHWWPESMSRTAYVESTARGESHTTPDRIIQLATDIAP